MKKLYTLTLAKTTGKQTIARAEEVFTAYIDNDFNNWNTDKTERKKPEIPCEVYELTENMTFAQMFTQPEKMVLTQSQIIEFCTNHKDKLSQDSRYTFFLFKVGEEFFVAFVLVLPDGLYVDVRRFSHDYVWFVENGFRFVLPQMISNPFEPLTLSHSDTVTLESRLKNVEQFMRDNFKGFTI